MLALASPAEQAIVTQWFDRAFEPGPLLRRPGPNLLAVRVYNRLGMGGLWQPVYLLSGDRSAGLQWLLVAARGETG